MLIVGVRAGSSVQSGVEPSATLYGILGTCEPPSADDAPLLGSFGPDLNSSAGSNPYTADFLPLEMAGLE